MIKTVDDR